MPNLLEKVQKFIHQEDLFPASQEHALLCAVSGGPDSVVLLHLLVELGYACAVAHVNYGLRPEADEEQTFVEQIGKKLGIPVHVKQAGMGMQVDQHSTSVQNEARKIRYQFFEELSATHQYFPWVTAHHKDDQVETLLFNLIRGRSSRVMKGIPHNVGHIVRPLIECTKEELIAYAEQHNIPYYIDATNAELKYLRNQIRNLVVPELKKINPNIADQMIEKAKLADQYVHFFEREYQRHKSDMIRLETRGGEESIHFLLDELEERMGKVGAELAVFHYLEEMGIRGSLIREGLKLMHAESGKSIAFPHGVLLKDRNRLIYALADWRIVKYGPLYISRDQCDGQPILWESYRIEAKVVSADDWPFPVEEGSYVADLAKIRFPIQLRNWQEGDRMQPFGMQGTKKLSDIFINKKWSLHQKSTAVVLEDQDQIICLLAYRICESIKITPETTQILQITIRHDDQV